MIGSEQFCLVLVTFWGKYASMICTAYLLRAVRKLWSQMFEHYSPFRRVKADSVLNLYIYLRSLKTDSRKTERRLIRTVHCGVAAVPVGHFGGGVLSQPTLKLAHTDLFFFAF